MRHTPHVARCPTSCRWRGRACRKTDVVVHHCCALRCCAPPFPNTERVACGTLARLRTLWSDLIAPTISVHNGRVVKRTGDGSIIEFRSVVDAVRCAIEVQNGMVERNTGLPPERRIALQVANGPTTNPVMKRRAIGLLRPLRGSCRWTVAQIARQHQVGVELGVEPTTYTGQ